MPDWRSCISWMDGTIQTTSTTTPTPGWRKNTVFPPPETKTYQLEDGSIRVEVGTFWKVVSSWHLVDPAENQLIHAYRTHHTGAG